MATYIAGPVGAAVVAGLGEGIAQSAEIDSGRRQGYDTGAIVVAAVSAYFGAKYPMPAGSGFGTRFLEGAGQAIGNRYAAYQVNRSLGQEDHWNWSTVSVSAVSAGLTNGIFGAGGTQPGTTTAPNNISRTTQAFNWTAVGKLAAEAVAKSAIQYGAEKAFTGEAHWAWSSVATTAATDIGAAWAHSVRTQQQSASHMLTTEELLNWKPSDASVANDDSGTFSERYPDALASNEDSSLLTDKLSRPMLDAGSLSNSSEGSVQINAVSGGGTSKEALDAMQADIDRWKSQGHDVTYAQSELDRMRAQGNAKTSTVDLAAPTAEDNISNGIGLGVYRSDILASGGSLMDRVPSAPQYGPFAAGYVYGSASGYRSIDKTMPAEAGESEGFELEPIAEAVKMSHEATEVTEKVAHILKGPFGIKFNWSVPAGYAEHLVATGSKPLKFVQGAALSSVEISRSAQVLRDADLVANTAKVLKYVGPVATTLAPITLVAEGWLTYQKPGHGDIGDWGHFGVETAVVGIGMFASAPVALTVVGAWAVSDYFVQDYSYKGQSGWRALGHSYSDQMQKIQKVDPNFYLGPKF